MSMLHKYPRTHHIEGSGIQKGDEELNVFPFRTLAGKHLVIEEKMDGANSAVSFDSDGRLLLQSRGHYLVGGPREKQFHLLKKWANTYTTALAETLSDRYVMYGEWLYAKHTLFYTDLPHYFMEFDMYDTLTDEFLSTERRKILLAPLPFVASVKVLYEGCIPDLRALQGLIDHSHFISEDCQQHLRNLCTIRQLDSGQVMKETDTSTLMEGLYIKVEEDGVVKERYKYVRASFLQTVFDSESHWLDRPLLPNNLKAGVELF
jgi:RNA ligase